MKFANSIFKTFLLSVLIIAQVHFAYAQTASILPPAKTQFLDNNGKPLTSGTVDFYIPPGTTRKTTWQDSAATIANTNPVVLDAAGRALILGSGSYRQVVKDRLNNVIWDAVTASPGGGGSSGNTADGNPVGAIIPWSGFVAPTNYLFTYGQEVSRTTYSVLFGQLTLTQPIICASGNATITGVPDTSQLKLGAAVEASCLQAGSTIVSTTVNTVTLNKTAIVSTTVNATFFPWGNGNGITSFNIPDLRGLYLPGRNNMGGAAGTLLTNPNYNDPNSLGGFGGNQTTSITLALANLPTGITSSNAAQNIIVTGPSGHTLLSDGNSPTTSTTPGGGTTIGVLNNTIQGVFTNGFSFSGSNSINVTSNNTSGTAYIARTLPPSRTLNYIIKVVGSVNSITTGVTTLGGMTGDIICGTGLTCSSQTISSNLTLPYSIPNDFGAVCDGVTDDAISLQLWLTFIGTNKRTGYIPPGLACVTGTTLVGLDNTSILGGGSNVSTLKGIGSALPILSFINKSNINLVNFSLEGSDNVTSWAVSSIGAISWQQTSGTVSGLTLRGIKLSKFNTSYWAFISTVGNISDITLQNNYWLTTAADIPTDPSPSNNGNYALAIFSSSGGSRVNNTMIQGNKVDGTGVCHGFALFDQNYKWQIQDNYLTDVGATNFSHCVDGFGVANNSYPILIYDSFGDGNPPRQGLVQNNNIINPRSAGIYLAGDGVIAHSALAFNDFDVLVTGNNISGQSSSDDSLPRAAISINDATNVSVVGNFLYNNYGGITAIGQTTGTINIENNFCSTIAGSGTGIASCIYTRPSAITVTNTPIYNINGNYLDVGSGAGTQVVRSFANALNYYGSINFTNNKVISSDIGVNFNGIYVNKSLTITGNHFSGVAATNMLNFGAIGAGTADVRENIFDLISSTTGTGMVATSSVAYMFGNVFKNRTSGAAFAFSGVGTTGSLNGMQFNNVTTANQVVATSIGLAIPTWSGFSQDFVQNLAIAAGGTQTIGWVNTSSGINWAPQITFGTLGTGVATALGINVGTAGSFVVNGGALGSPSSIGTLPAFTLGGTIAGGGNQLNNIIIGTTTPLAGIFTTLTANTSISSPIHTSSGSHTFQSNGSTFAGYITTGQQWLFGGSALTPLTGPTLTITKNTSATPAIGTPTGITGTTQNVLTLVGTDTNSSDLVIQQFGTGNPAIRYFKAQGTAASPTAVTTGLALGANFGYGYYTSGGPAYAGGSGFVFQTTENWTSTNTGARVDIYGTPTGSTGVTIGASVGASLMVGTTTDGAAGQIIINNAAFMMRTKTAFTNGAGIGAGTITNAPAAGNPTKWIAIDDNGTTRQIPAW